MKNFLALVIFMIIYIPLLLLTLIFEGLTGVKTYIYNAHQTFKTILFELGLDF